MLNAGADKDAKTDDNGRTALHDAAQQGYVKCVELLINAGCDVNTVSSEGVSVLHEAVLNDNLDCVSAPVHAGVNINIQIDGSLLNDYADETNDEALKAALRVKCAQCNKTGSDRNKLKACAACRRTFYCSRACQAAHWRIHKPLCKVKPVET